MTDTPPLPSIDEVIDAVVAGLKGHPQYRKEPTMTDTTHRTATDRNEQRALASMFCWNMALDAGTKALRCKDAGDEDGANRWALTVAHYLKNYARLQYGDK
jgi:hypothetical protein